MNKKSTLTTEQQLSYELQIIENLILWFQEDAEKQNSESSNEIINYLLAGHQRITNELKQIKEV